MVAADADGCWAVTAPHAGSVPWTTAHYFDAYWAPLCGALVEAGEPIGMRDEWHNRCQRCMKALAAGRIRAEASLVALAEGAVERLEQFLWEIAR